MGVGEIEIDWNYLLEKLESLIDLGEEYLSRQVTEYELDPAVFSENTAFRWHSGDDEGYLNAVLYPDVPELGDLIGIDENIKRLRRNTLQFIKSLPANNILLWGDRGTGKSSAVKGLLNEFGNQGLRVVEVDKKALFQLPLIAETLRPHPYRFILFCDDLAFDRSECGLRELKSLLEGSLQSRPENVVIYATSNQRYLTPEPLSEKGESTRIPSEETFSEKLSLSDRFGITLAFHQITEDDYLKIVRHLASKRNLDITSDRLDNEARRWAEVRGSLSGRLARQFIDDISGFLALERMGALSEEPFS